MKRDGARRGQAFIMMALALTVLCAMLALGVDVGLTATRAQSLHSAAEAAADAGAYTVYGWRTGSNTSATDATVWKGMVSALTNAGLTVMNNNGSGSTTAPADPCTAGYRFNQVAITATYLDVDNNVITDTSSNPVAVGAGGAIPSAATGVSVGKLEGCQPAAFGAVIGHPRYPIAVAASAGQALQGPTSTPTTTATPMPTATNTPIPTNTPTATPINTPTATPVAYTVWPYAVSGAPNGNCNPPPNNVPLVANDQSEFYCTGAYTYTNTIGSAVTLFSNNGSTYGSSGSFKGYIGSAAVSIDQQTTVNDTQLSGSSGGGNNGPSPCPSTVTVPIISRVYHIGGNSSSELFVVLAILTVNISQCGNPTTGTIASVVTDPHGIVSVPGTTTPTPTPAGTATPTSTPTATLTPTPTPTRTVRRPVIH